MEETVISSDMKTNEVGLGRTQSKTFLLARPPDKIDDSGLVVSGFTTKHSLNMFTRSGGTMRQAGPVYQQVETSSDIAPGHHSGPTTEKTPCIAENPTSNSVVAGCISETFVTSQGTILFDMDNHRLELTSFTSNKKISSSIEEAILKSLSYVSGNRFCLRVHVHKRMVPVEEAGNQYPGRSELARK
ncbi:Hypothetical protein PP7435_CHR1-1037 [Komagataella phaffii CBS 7435]|uniref:Uncharacterized protein n=1 Tax=Komagataella phaffii (strain ATCC 76273 / CBS 7435 / CECT 11047 / NRRL Y-11430 / Wegner 21-1) TaxID=981350 RepID=F2QLD5_KOMPC|nr:Hypothetical protein BQ9382_C1-5461 [Komagataella phaffii CBS 7435]CCA37167.1 Hypothetical protein PP7435_CHR1-1037 [Komagataella phaffii CBS 7435]